MANLSAETIERELREIQKRKDVRDAEIKKQQKEDAEYFAKKNK